MFKVKLSVGSKNVTGSIGGVGSTENDENIFMGHQTVDLRAIPEATGLSSTGELGMMDFAAAHVGEIDLTGTNVMFGGEVIDLDNATLGDIDQCKPSSPRNTEVKSAPQPIQKSETPAQPAPTVTQHPAITGSKSNPKKAAKTKKKRLASKENKIEKPAEKEVRIPLGTRPLEGEEELKEFRPHKARRSRGSRRKNNAYGRPGPQGTATAAKKDKRKKGPRKDSFRTVEKKPQTHAPRKPANGHHNAENVNVSLNIASNPKSKGQVEKTSSSSKTVMADVAKVLANMGETTNEARKKASVEPEDKAKNKQVSEKEGGHNAEAKEVGEKVYQFTRAELMGLFVRYEKFRAGDPLMRKMVRDGVGRFLTSLP
ncbi:hypothetical protein AAMO2058_000440800 [Amorphochlora amoebiformis]